MTDPNATAALEETNPAENEGTTEQSSENSFFIPKDIIGDKEYKAGDKITLEVMGSDEDGDLEVCLPGAATEGGDWRDDLKTELTNAGSESGKEPIK
jgi:hypothetical protein